MWILLLIFIAIDVIQQIYIRHLKKEIALRDGTYTPKTKKSRLLEWLKSLFWIV